MINARMGHADYAPKGSIDNAVLNKVSYFAGMIFILLGITLGLALGFLSFYQLELFLAGSFLLALVGSVVLRLLIPFSRTIATELSPAGERQSYIQSYFNMLEGMFKLLPEAAQTGVFLVPVFIVIGRFLTWMHYAACPESALPLTEAERREATMNKFSLKRPRN